MSAASIAAEVEGMGVSLSVLRPYAAHCIKLVQKEGTTAFGDWAAGQYSNMITTPNTPPRQPLPC